MAIVLGIVATVAALPMVLGGAGLLLVDQARDDGFFTTPTGRLATQTAAITTEPFDVTREGPQPAFVDRLLTFRITVTPTSSDGLVFVGVGPADEVADLLRDVPHARLSEGWELRTVRGRDPLPPPATADVAWVAASSGAGTQQVEWTATDGDWAVLVANEDGARVVSVEAELGWAGFRLAPIGWAALVTGTLLGIGGLISLLLGIIRR